MRVLLYWLTDIQSLLNLPITNTERKIQKHTTLE